MAWSIISSAIGTNTATLGTHAAGDLILVWAYRDGSTTAPNLASGYTNIQNQGVSTNSARCAFKIAASGSETVGTFTNATSLIVVVIRNGRIGSYTQNGGSSTTFNYPALTLLENDASSGLIGFVGTRNGTSPASIDTPPSGMTLLTSVKDATDSAGCHYDLSATSWSSTNVATGVAATGWRTAVIEILDQELPTNYVGNSSVFTTEFNSLPSDTQAGYQVELPVDCTIDEIWVYMGHFDASGQGKCGFYSDSSDEPLNLIQTGDEFNHNLFPAWRKSKGFSYSAIANEKIWPSVASNDTWKVYADATTGIGYDQSSIAYASAFKDPSNSTGRNIGTASFSIIVAYTPTGSAPDESKFFFMQ